MNSTDKKQVKWALESPLALSLEGELKFNSSKDIITSVSFNEPELTISVGDTQMFRKMPFKVNIIDKTSPTKCELKIASRTKSSVFIMPMLSGSKDLYFYNTLFLNCFIATEDYPNSIILLYRFSGSALFLKFEQALKKFTTFKDMIDPSPHHVMFVFDIPSKYKDDYNKFILGKYSHFSPELKDAIFKFHKTDMHSSLGQILYKSEKRRLRLSQNLGMEIPTDMELFDIPDPEDEIYNPKIYINE
tara:strand:+ start:1019 stop:1756 length:738 start_codon:yes stop_codon:yes gene_type:complete